MSSSKTPITEISASERARVEKRVTIFYQKHSPENIGTVPKAMGLQVDEATLIEKLCLKYGVHERAEEKEAKEAGCYPGQQEILPGAQPSSSPAFFSCVPPQLASELAHKNVTIKFAESVHVVTGPKKEQERILVITFARSAQIFDTALII